MPRSHPNIFRYEHHHFVGWMVSIKRRGERHVRYVSDKNHGGPAGALQAAVRVRGRLLLELPPELRTKTVYAANSTGVVGVTLTRERTRTGAVARRYSAVWPRTDGKGSHKRSFSVEKWGKTEAFRRAVAARAEGIARLLDERRRAPLPARGA